MVLRYRLRHHQVSTIDNSGYCPSRGTLLLGNCNKFCGWSKEIIDPSQGKLGHAETFWRQIPVFAVIFRSVLLRRVFYQNYASINVLQTQVYGSS